MRHIRIFVSSPGDCSRERDVLGEIVERINETDGARAGYVLRAFKWEAHVVPRIGPPPQAVIEDQTPFCDIYLGIMSSRFGGDEKRESGTEQEFRTVLRESSRTPEVPAASTAGAIRGAMRSIRIAPTIGYAHRKDQSRRGLSVRCHSGRRGSRVRHCRAMSGSGRAATSSAIRAALRIGIWHNPPDRLSFVGFRVVVSGPQIGVRRS